MISKVEQLKRKRRIKNDPSGVLLEEISNLKEEFDEFKKKEFELELNRDDFKGDTGKVGIQGRPGDKGDIGDTGTRGDKGDRGDTGRAGEKGDTGDKGETGEDGKDGENGRPPKHEIKAKSIRFENQDGTWGKWLKIGKKDSQFGGGKSLHRGGVKYVRDRFTDECDGATKTFTLSRRPDPDTVTVEGTYFPIIYDPGIDFTVDVSAKTVTLTSEVGAPEESHTLLVTYIEG